MIATGCSAEADNSTSEKVGTYQALFDARTNMGALAFGAIPGSKEHDLASEARKLVDSVLHEMDRALLASATPVNPEEIVRVTAADYNGRDWDGLPFSALPEWLKEAIDQEIVTIEPSSTDYARWRVITVVGPDDQIVRSSLTSVLPEKRSDSQT